MDTMKLLLGATVAVLFGALVMSWKGMENGVRNTPAGEIARLEKQIEELKLEQLKIQQVKQLQLLRSSSPPPQPTPGAELEAMRTELAAKEAALRQIEEDKRMTQLENKVEQDEEGLLEQRKLENTDSELRRARLISDALLMGRVTEFAESPEYGNFITFDVLMPESIQAGSVLAIRRKTGILGQLKVSEISPEGAIANLLPGFGQVKPQVGDELILPPQY